MRTHAPIRHTLAIFVLGFFIIAGHQATSAQTFPNVVGSDQSMDEDAATSPDGLLVDTLGRSTPRGFVTGLLQALADKDFERAAKFLETGSTDDGAALARMLQRVLDRSGSVISSSRLSDKSEGRLDDHLPPDIDVFGTVRTEQGQKDLLARRVEHSGGEVWVVASETLLDLPLLSVTANNPIGNLPSIIRNAKGPVIFDVYLAHWAILFAFALLSYLLALAVTYVRRFTLKGISRTTRSDRLSRFAHASGPPVRLFLTAVIFSLGVPYLGVSVVARFQVGSVVQTAAGFAFAWFLWRMIDAIADASLDRMSRRGQLTAFSTVSFASRVAKGIIVILFLTFGLHAFGVDVTAGFAALGIGGLAFALGAQKLFENLLGSMTLIADRPVRVGDFCRFGDTMGTIEEIGIRSTRIRTLDRTLVTVPNGEFSDLHLENYTLRDRFWFHHHLGLRYETSPRQIRTIISEVRNILSEHPAVEAEPQRVRFVKFNAYSLDIEVFAYIRADDLNGFLEIQEDLMLQFMDVVDRCGSSFAFPSQTVYLQHDTELQAAA